MFLQEYGNEFPQAGVRVLEIGSKAHDAQDTYRPLFPAPRFAYTGLDIEAGNNVDIVPANTFVWSEIADGCFDLCLSASTFEHNPFFWITFAEVARVTRPGGLALIIAPGAGHVHRYPYDCWRFYPDSWGALCTMTGMELVESYFETDKIVAANPENIWRDSAVVARKPRLSGPELDAFHARLRKIVSLFVDERPPSQIAPERHGKWVHAYERYMENKYPMTLGRAIHERIRRPPRIYKRT
jgi:SAM-dependent methyltransferase